MDTSRSRRGARRRGLRCDLAGGLCLVVALILVTAWVLPHVSDAASRWLQEKPVRGRTIDVAGVRPGSVPPGLVAPSPDTESPAVDAAEEETGPRLWPETSIVDAGLRFNLVGAVGSLASAAQGEVDASPIVVNLRTSLDGESWSDWMTMRLGLAPIDALAGGNQADGESEAEELVAEPIWVGEARYVEFDSSGPVAGLKLSFVNSLGDATVADRLTGVLKGVVASIAQTGRLEVAEAQAAQPAIVRRAQWGADESWRRVDPSYAAVKMAFVHHTASGNSYSAAEAPAVVRAIYYYHARTCGFNDIGYNFLIDRYGTIYEGRYGGISEGVIGAQTLGFNTGSTGVALIGEFGSSAVPSAALASLKKLLAWKLDVHHINPTSRVSMYCGASDRFSAGQTAVLPAISGHRDACYTSCPGAALYAQLGNVRSAVATLGLPKIYAPTVAPALFSPNGDGRTDVTTIAFSASESVSWRVEVRASDGALVRSYTGSGSSCSRTWDGRDASGDVVADGAYTASVTAESSRGVAREARLGVTVDTEPLAIDAVSLTPAALARLADGSRERCQIRYTLSEGATTRVTIRSLADGKRLRTVSNYRAVAAGPRTVTWDGAIEWAGRRIPAPDGDYRVLVEGEDAAGTRATQRVLLSCRSDLARWGTGATFVTQTTRSFTIRRGRRATFSFIALYASPVGETARYSRARLVLKIRDSQGRSRYTRILPGKGLNALHAATIERCNLARGTYRYYVLASLPDGTRQQMSSTRVMRIL